MIFLATAWGHALAALLYATLAVWQMVSRRGGLRGLILALACALSAVWAILVTVNGPTGVSAGVAQNLRDMGWLAFMLVLQPPDKDDRRRVAIIGLHVVIMLVLLAGIAIELLPPGYEGSPRIQEGLFVSILIFRMMTTIGALVLVHNLYTAASPEARWSIGLPMVALAAMWAYDLNLATVAYLMGRWPGELFVLRGFVLALLTPLLVAAARRGVVGHVRLSRAATFQTLSLIAIGGYLAIMVLLARLLELARGDFGKLAQVTVVLAVSALALLLFPSPKLRGWLKTTVIRHFFQHRYDYRVEWRRFTDTIGQAGEGAAPLDQRVIQAIADITESPGGLLMVPADDGGLITATRWRWPGLEAPQRAADAALANYFEQTTHVIELDPLRKGETGDVASLLPRWMIDEAHAWVLVPLVHFDRLVGVALLEQPVVNRLLDWEDHDLLRVAGRQVASYLAEARKQEELSDSRRFDEFNRRFAFVIHDIKNLVSQLSLVTRNAEKHADNPAFRADMIATLQSSVGKMNDLLARLSQHHRSRPEEPRAVALKPLVERIIQTRYAQQLVNVHGRHDIVAPIDPGRLEQALVHLIQNGLEASQPGEAVDIQISRRGLEAVIDVIDRGCGMSGDYIRGSLFRPFASTKADGFGIGAFEARTLIAAMAGRLDVESREGEGTRFSIIFPVIREIGESVSEART